MKKNIAVIFGSRSVEHEISIITAHQVLSAIDREKYNVIPIYISKDGQWYTGKCLEKIDNFKDTLKLEKKATPIKALNGLNGKLIVKTPLKKFLIDVCILATHGTYGEDGSLQGLCEVFNVPYTGSGILGSTVGMDKVISKIVLRSNNIPVVDFLHITDHEWRKNKDEFVKKCEEELGFPLYIKPALLGSSIGINKAKTREELFEAIETALLFGHKVIVEKAVENAREINCAVMGYREPIVSVFEEILRKRDFFDYNEKYLSKGKDGKFSNHKIPANLNKKLEQMLKNVAISTFKVLECYGNIRIDFLVKNEEVYVSEVNTIPGAFAYYLWQASGLTFSQVIDNMISIAESVHKDKNRKVFSVETNVLSLRVGK
ncbi:D-alanine--D-alanine ligase [Thermosipho ferrireducens]|uniref:D-alanine--D-alanine ligase n=1 Tax=Thermosipho ferrireducens TaxID=2571116 RepID=A0ABX7S6Y5_9BACT|nr:D-alanine--D-alanine ligase family protein [Thermosipho ferrireducens]QTA38347.1 D-alanine--D-alanine ligase [Thermosipho ferrireducens]